MLPRFIEPMESRRLLSSADSVVLLNDNFNNGVDPRHFQLPLWATGGTFYGRTQVKVRNESPLPKAVNGAVQLMLGTYNPTYNPNDPNQVPSFSGTELDSTKTYRIGNGLHITYVAKLDRPYVGGYVMGLFVIGKKADGNHDEVDFEITSNDRVNGNNIVRTNIYTNEKYGTGDPQSHPMKKRTSTSSYHTYELFCYKYQTVWKVDGKTVRTSDRGIEGPVKVVINDWAPAQEWPEAYNAQLQPTAIKSKDKEYSVSVDNLKIESILKAVDHTPPSPNPSTWEIAPHATSISSITMRATLATDLSKVYYSFENLTIPGHNSGWQTAATYTDVGLSADTTYSYRVVTRDSSPRANTGQYSATLAATTEPLGPLGITITHVTQQGEPTNIAQGVVSGIQASDYDDWYVALYIKVFGGWWNKPYWDYAKTPIQADGTWSNTIFTNTNDPGATEVRAYLFPNTFDVPIRGGHGTFPDEVLPYLYAEVSR